MIDSPPQPDKGGENPRAFNGVVALTATEFSQVEECMKNPGGSTRANQQGAQLLRRLYKSVQIQ